MEKEIMKASCIHCGKEVFSLYKKQLDYNIKAHEISCVLRKKQELHPEELNSGDALNNQKSQGGKK